MGRGRGEKHKSRGPRRLATARSRAGTCRDGQGSSASLAWDLKAIRVGVGVEKEGELGRSGRHGLLRRVLASLKAIFLIPKSRARWRGGMR